MRKFILLCLLVFTVSSVVFAQQMTDEQVILYVQEAQSQGKTQQEMLVELMKKGVTKEQIQRIQSKYSGKSDGSSEENANFMGEANSRLRTQKTYENKNKNISQDESGLDNLGSQKQSIKGLRAKSTQQRNGYGRGGITMDSRVMVIMVLKARKTLLHNRFSDIIFSITNI